MRHSSENSPEHTGLTCPTCGTRVHPRVRETGYETPCPDCDTPVKVPSRDELTARLSDRREQRRPQSPTETYRLAGPSSEAGERHESPPPETVTVLCPVCEARLHPRLKERPRRIKCPDCEGPVPVPARETVLQEKRSRHAAAIHRRGGESYRLTAPPADDRRRRSNAYSRLWQAQGEVRTELPPPAPRWTFFTGVFGFPWRPDNVSRWMWLSLGFLAVGWVLCAALYVAGRAAGYFGVVLAFFAMPLIWLSVWSFSYAAACGMAILQDTAAGNDRVTEWPEPNWREWAVQLFYVAFVLLVTAVLAYAAGRAALLLDGPFWTSCLAVAFLLFPLLLLSALETGSVFLPVSGPVLRSLLRLWRAWPVFYGLTAALWSAWAAAVVVSLQSLGGAVTVLWAAPVLTAVLFISARLMGRLAWSIAQDSEG